VCRAAFLLARSIATLDYQCHIIRRLGTRLFGGPPLGAADPVSSLLRTARLNAPQQYSATREPGGVCVMVPRRRALCEAFSLGLESSATVPCFSTTRRIPRMVQNSPTRGASVLCRAAYVQVPDSSSHNGDASGGDYHMSFLKRVRTYPPAMVTKRPVPNFLDICFVSQTLPQGQQDTLPASP
jgi:hypothetical protein